MGLGGEGISHKEMIVNRGPWSVVREGGTPFRDAIFVWEKNFISYESEIFLNEMMFLIRVWPGKDYFILGQGE